MLGQLSIRWHEAALTVQHNLLSIPKLGHNFTNDVFWHSLLNDLDPGSVLVVQLGHVIGLPLKLLMNVLILQCQSLIHALDDLV